MTLRLAASDSSDGPIHSKTTNNHQKKGGFAQQKIKILRPIFSLLLAPPFCRWSQICRTEAEPVNCWEGQPRLISPDDWLAVTVAPGFWWITIKSISKVLKIGTPICTPRIYELGVCQFGDNSGLTWAFSLEQTTTDHPWEQPWTSASSDDSYLWTKSCKSMWHLT